MTVTDHDADTAAILAEAEAVADVIDIGRTEAGIVTVTVPTTDQARAVAERLGMNTRGATAHLYGCAYAMRDLTRPDKAETPVLVVVVAVGA